MVCAQIGEAPVMPEATDDMGVLSLFPTQVATKKSFVYPKVQLSRKLFVVPVFTATFLPGRLRIELKPNAGARAAGSERIELI